MTTWTEMTALQLATAVLAGTIPRDAMVLTRSVEVAPASTPETEKSSDPQLGPRQSLSDDTSAAPTPTKKSGRPPRPENQYLPNGSTTRVDPGIKKKRRVGKTPELRRMKAFWVAYRKGALQRRMPPHEPFENYLAFCARCQGWMAAGEPLQWEGWSRDAAVHGAGSHSPSLATSS